jgi:hypothetical protein
MKSLFLKSLPIALLAVNLSGDSMMSLLAIWEIIKLHGSLISLGLCLTAASVLPFLLQKISNGFAFLIRRRPLASFRLVRSISGVAYVACAAFSQSIDLNAFYVILIGFTVLSTISQQALEMSFLNLTVGGQTKAIDASRALQTSIQIGATLGMLGAGYLLDDLGMWGVFVAGAVTMLAGIAVTTRLLEFVVAGTGTRGGRPAEVDVSTAVRPAMERWLVMNSGLAALGVVTIQLGAYNFLAPLLISSVKIWSSSAYGVIAAAAAVGAILSTAKWWTASPSATAASRYAAIACFPLFDGLMAWSENLAAVGLGSFMLGWAVSLTRLVWRGQIFSLARSTTESGEWAARITFIYQFGRSAFPLFFAIVASQYATIDIGNTRWIMTGAGIGVGIIFSILAVIERIAPDFVALRPPLTSVKSQKP